MAQDQFNAPKSISEYLERGYQPAGSTTGSLGRETNGYQPKSSMLHSEPPKGGSGLPAPGSTRNAS